MSGSQSIKLKVSESLTIFSDAGIKSPTTEEPVKRQKVSKIRIRRPRNQFIIYRQWMSAKLHAENPGLTAACICKFLPVCLLRSMNITDIKQRKL